MKITFLGGTETVTGSKYLLETEQAKILIDCGLFQGYKSLRERNRKPLKVDLNTLDAVLVTHAHLDHSGYIPVVYKNGFRGPIFTHHATRDLCKILLPDSGHIQESDARYYSKHRLSKHKDPSPLYDQATAEKSLSLFRTLDFYEKKTIKDITFWLQPAGHILGAASIIVEADGKRIGFSGDVGRPNDLFMNAPHPLPDLDLLLLESTYGNRRHDEGNVFELVEKVVNETLQQGGRLLIPAFAVGRAQVLQHVLAVLMKEKRIPKIPVYLDSPMAINASDIYCHYHKEHRLDQQECLAMCNAVTYTQKVDESKALAGINYPHIIIAGSGMATGGRILHHFKHWLNDSRTRVLFAGYQAGGTRGDKMLSGAESIKIHGAWIPVKARIHMFSGLSGHADYVDMANWLNESSITPKTQIMLVHGSSDALEGMRDYLSRSTEFQPTIATDGQIIAL